MILSAKINHKNQIWVGAVLAVLFALSLIRYEYFAGKRHFGDFHVYYVTGERISNRSEIYFEKEENLTPFKYSPLIASWFAVLATTPEPVAAGAWHLLNLILLWLCVFVSWQMIARAGLKNSRKRSGWAIFAGLLCVSPSILHCLNSGQVGLAIATAYYLGIYFMLQGQSAKSAWFFAFAAMFKYLPIIILPYFFFKRDLKFLISFGIALIALHFLPAVWLGWSQNFHYLKSFIPHLTATTLDHISLLDFKNQSIWAYGYRLLYLDLGCFQIADHPERLTYLGAGFLLVLYSLLIFRKGSVGQLRTLVDLAVLGILIVIFNPNAWKHNFVLLLLPCLLVASRVVSDLKFDFKTMALLVMALAFLCTNRSVLGWGMRHDLMSLSILPVASLILLLAVLRIDRGHNSLLDSC